ncbi:hypothetical protein [Chryseobacterium kwangjuense]|uniref:Uncharacterized protein n=1 Tax=Chryseobacterium kwangjuense TaxID=267125 RepID=A0A135W449_9FLAO|nr:hypothetical protein [Chryseobacterium kwangjuense]KXH79683.1 hypothetical protein AU378_20190 [Chryseobacterium kwangjuense]
MKRPIILLLFPIFFSAHSQVSDKTASIIKSLEKFDSFYALDNEKVKDVETRLYKDASSNELIILAGKGKNEYIKATAIKVLAQKADQRLLDIFKDFFYSKEKIVYSTSCLSHEQLISAYIFETVSSEDKNENSFSEKDRTHLEKEMVSLVLNAKPVNKELLETLSYALPENQDTYTKIREQVIDTRSPELLVTLAKYKNPNDIELIKSFGAEAYPAIEEFPDPKFLPFMKEHFKDSSSFPFMFALSGFCSEEANEIIPGVIEYNKSINKERDCDNGCLSFLYQQIEMKKCTLNYPLLADLWLTDKIISFNVLDDYEKNHTQAETEKFLLDGFLKPGEAEIIAVNAYDMDHVMDYVSGDMTFDATLRLVTLLQKTKKISQNAYEKAVRNSLQNIDDLDVDGFISKLNDNALVLQNKDVLLDRIKNNESAYGILIIMDGVKALNDKKLFSDGAAIVVQRKEEFKEFSIWETKYRNFIKENHIKE